MVFIYNPELFDLEITKKELPNGDVFFYEDVFCKESKKKTQENAEKGYKKIPLVTAKLKYETELANFEKVPAYVTSYKRTTKNGKTNITAKITECTEDRSDVGFLAAIPIKGYICGFGADEGIEPLKAVLKYVDKFQYKGESYTQIVYVVGRVSKSLSNLLGSLSIDAHVISKDDTVTTYTTEINFQNEEISQTTRPFMTKQGAEEVEKAKRVGDYPFSDMANSITEKFAKEYKENNNRHGGRRNYNGGNGKKPHYNNKSSNDLVIPDPPYQGDKNSYRNKKRKKK